MSRGTWITVLAGLAVLVLLATQLRWALDREEEARNEQTDDPQLVVDRELGAAYFEEERYAEAREALGRAAAAKGATAQDLVNAACVEISASDGTSERAKALLEQAKAVDADLPSVHYCLGVIATRANETEQAIEAFSRVVEIVPSDMAARLSLADALEKAGRGEEARRELQCILDAKVEFAGSFYLVALYKLSMALRRSGQVEEGKALLAEHRRLSDEGMETPQQRELELGTLAKVRVPRPAPRLKDEGQARPVTFTEVSPPVGASVGAVHRVRAFDVDGDRRRDLVLLGETQAVVALRRADAAEEIVPVAQGRFDDAWVADLHQHATEPRKSVLLSSADGLTLHIPAPAPATGYVDSPLPRKIVARDAEFVDEDHDGDLDLLIATADGLVLLRHDGAPTEGGEEPGQVAKLLPVLWTEISAEAGLPSGSFDWVAIEDFDADQDIDFLAGTPSGPRLLSNLRQSHFEMLDPANVGLPTKALREPVLEDLDHDGLVDVWWGVEGAFLRNLGRSFDGAVGNPPAGAAYTVADVDLDGSLDVVRAEDGALRMRRGPLTRAGGTVTTLPAKALPGQDPLVVDLDGDGDLDLVAPAAAGVSIWRSDAAVAAKPFQLVLVGRKDNRESVGAVVEVRSGASFQRRLSRESLHSFGTDCIDVDVIRVLWPNGVVQYSTLPEAGTVLVLNQKEGLVGSCPFLYTYDGERYHFVSDILGITPLGLPMEEGMYVPPDHDELVRIRGDQLRPTHGEYVMQITEELREATYLDRAQLWVVDHPADVVLHPEERFTFPPFPPQTLHAMHTILPLEKATGSDGKDWTAALAKEDGDHAMPFRLAPPQFLGLVSPHTLELTLPEACRDAKRVRLLMTGWLYWTDASVNVAAGHHPQYEFVPPILSVPDGQGGWRPTGPPVGFPAGKTKTMVLEVGDLLNRDDLRLQVFSTIRLYWDQIQVCVDQGDAEVKVTKLEPKLARLYERGFSAPMPQWREDQPEQFEFDRLRPAPWNQHAGMLTKMGDVLPLLGDIDDRFVIFSGGDAIELRFDATAVGDVAPGFARTFLLFVDGWAKDGDPNTKFAGTVEPLPFHGMSGYPYGETEHYPDDEAHRRSLAEWNTRPGRRLVRSQVQEP